MNRILAPLILAALSVAGTALAADPESGKVSSSSPTTEWTGHVTDPAGAYDLATFFATGDTDGSCEAPACDTFALTVEGGGQDLTIEVEGDDAENVGIDVIKPDGSNQYENPAEVHDYRTLTIRRAPAGDYTINVFGTGDFDYEAKATFANRVPKATPTPEVTASPSPGATPAPSGSGTPAPAAKLTISAGRLSAKKLVKTRKLAASLTSSAAVTSVQVLLVRGKKAGGKLLASAKAARLDGRAKLTLKVMGKPKAGRHTLIVSAVDGQGRRVGTSKAVTLGR